MEQRWDKLKVLLVDTQHAVDINIETKKVVDELRALQETMKTYEKWANSIESIAEEAPEISRQLEQSKVYEFYLYICTVGNSIFLSHMFSKGCFSRVKKNSGLFGIGLKCLEMKKLLKK